MARQARPIRRRMLRRYTTLPSLLDLLVTKHLTLLTPDSWDDKNDAFYLQQYKDKKKLKAVYAMCFTEGNETYHHWRVFSGGNVGVCITFVYGNLMSYLEAAPQIAHDEVRYSRVKDLDKKPPTVAALPFVKRSAYSDEREYRIVYSDRKDALLAKRMPVGLDSIYKVTLSPWLPLSLYGSTKTAIRSIPGCAKLQVRRTNMLDSEQWKKIAQGVRA